jgi:LmbE family N-acetylglucosaminyl deacetylase
MTRSVAIVLLAASCREPSRAIAPSALRAACASPAPDPPPPTWRASETYATDVVLYAAHPDDESMYAGGTLARLASRGRKVTVVLASHGEGGRLLVHLGDGGFEERRDLPSEEVAKLRDDEAARAAKALGVGLAYLNPATARLDYGFTTSCDDAMAMWERALPGGVDGLFRRVVEDLRKRRPRVVVTLDRRDDPQGSRHGHHRAVGVVVELAARYAALDAAKELGAPVAIEELAILTPLGEAPEVTIAVDPAARRSALEAYGSQFKAEDLDGFGARPSEGFRVAWRAIGVPGVRSRLAELCE